MIAKIRLPSGAIYMLTAKGWEGANGEYAQALNAAFPFPPRSAAYDPNPIATVAQAAARALNAEIIELPNPPRNKPGVLY